MSSFDPMVVFRTNVKDLTYAIQACFSNKYVHITLATLPAKYQVKFTVYS